MKNYQIIICVFLLSSGCFRNKKNKCSNNEMQSKISYTQFSDILSTIGSKYKEGYIEFPHTLNDDENFRNIIGNPCKYRSFLIVALKDDNKMKVYKYIALYGLQHLCIDDYVDVLKIVFSEYEMGKVDEAFLMSSINQGGFSLEVCKNYTNRKLLQVLMSVMPTLKIEANKKLVDDVMSGASWRKMHEYFKESGEPAPWKCE